MPQESEPTILHSPDDGSSSSGAPERGVATLPRDSSIEELLSSRSELQKIKKNKRTPEDADKLKQTEDLLKEILLEGRGRGRFKSVELSLRQRFNELAFLAINDRDRYARRIEEELAQQGGENGEYIKGCVAETINQSFIDDEGERERYSGGAAYLYIEGIKLINKLLTNPRSVTKEDTSSELWKPKYLEKAINEGIADAEEKPFALISSEIKSLEEDDHLRLAIEAITDLGDNVSNDHPDQDELRNQLRAASTQKDRIAIVLDQIELITSFREMNRTGGPARRAEVEETINRAYGIELARKLTALSKPEIRVKIHERSAQLEALYEERDRVLFEAGEAGLLTGLDAELNNIYTGKEVQENGRVNYQDSIYERIRDAQKAYQDAEQIPEDTQEGRDEIVRLRAQHKQLLGEAVRIVEKALASAELSPESLEQRIHLDQALSPDDRVRFMGIRTHYIQSGLNELLKELRFRESGRYRLYNLPKSELEWSFKPQEWIMQKKEEYYQKILERRKSLKWEKQLNHIELHAESEEELYEALQQFLEDNLVVGVTDVNNTLELWREIGEAAMRKGRELGLDNDTRLRLRAEVEGRMLIFAAEYFAKTNKLEYFVQIMQLFSRNAADRITAVNKAFGGQVALAAHLMETDEFRELFFVAGDDPTQRNYINDRIAQETKKKELVDKLVERLVKSRQFKGEGELKELLVKVVGEDARGKKIYAEKSVEEFEAQYREGIPSFDRVEVYKIQEIIDKVLRGKERADRERKTFNIGEILSDEDLVAIEGFNGHTQLIYNLIDKIAHNSKPQNQEELLRFREAEEYGRILRATYLWKKKTNGHDLTDEENKEYKKLSKDAEEIVDTASRLHTVTLSHAELNAPRLRNDQTLKDLLGNHGFDDDRLISYEEAIRRRMVAREERFQSMVDQLNAEIAHLFKDNKNMSAATVSGKTTKELVDLIKDDKYKDVRRKIDSLVRKREVMLSTKSQLKTYFQDELAAGDYSVVDPVYNYFLAFDDPARNAFLNLDRDPDMSRDNLKKSIAKVLNDEFNLDTERAAFDANPEIAALATEEKNVRWQLRLRELGVLDRHRILTEKRGSMLGRMRRVLFAFDPEGKVQRYPGDLREERDQLELAMEKTLMAYQEAREDVDLLPNLRDLLFWESGQPLIGKKLTSHDPYIHSDFRNLNFKPDTDNLIYLFDLYIRPLPRELGVNYRQFAVAMQLQKHRQPNILDDYEQERYYDRLKAADNQRKIVLGGTVEGEGGKKMQTPLIASPIKDPGKLITLKMDVGDLSEYKRSEPELRIEFLEKALERPLNFAKGFYPYLTDRTHTPQTAYRAGCAFLRKFVNDWLLDIEKSKAVLRTKKYANVPDSELDQLRKLNDFEPTFGRTYLEEIIARNIKP